MIIFVFVDKYPVNVFLYVNLFFFYDFSFLCECKISREVLFDFKLADIKQDSSKALIFAEVREKSAVWF